METRTATGAEPVAPWARRFVWAFLAAFVIAGVFGIEAWPLTGWRLFADARTAKQVSWQGVTVDAAGRERPIPWDDLPVRFRGDVRAVRIYQVEPDVSRRVGDRAARGTRNLRFTCGDGTVRSSGGPGG